MSASTRHFIGHDLELGHRGQLAGFDHRARPDYRVEARMSATDLARAAAVGAAGPTRCIATA